jgi:hypothetical protein
VFDGVANQGYVLVNDNTTLLLRNTIDNTDGKIALALSGQSDLQIDGTVTLKNGEVELNTSGDEITALATGATLENSANIHGQGQIGAGDGTPSTICWAVSSTPIKPARPSISTPATPSRIMERWRQRAAVR